MNRNDPRKALGKGLHSLLPVRSAAAPAPIAEQSQSQLPKDGNVLLVPVEHVVPNPKQPRREFETQAMLELAQSIERDGIIQPILVRRVAPNQYQIVAGERRWRAAQLAGLKEIPVIPRTATDEQVMELALIENIQREDLNPVELATAFGRMVTELGLSHEQIGEKTGKDRATVTNTIRLLQLPVEILEFVEARKLSPGHARALLKLGDKQIQRQVAEICVREGWSVRQIEEYTKPKEPGAAGPEKGKGGPSGGKAPKEPTPLDPNVKAAIVEMEQKLGTRVRIVERGKDKGHIEIEYYSSDDLDRVYGMIVGEPA